MAWQKLFGSIWKRALFLVAFSAGAVWVIHWVTPATSSASVFFAIGPGDSDVIPHQIVRAQDDRLYLFAGLPYTNQIRAYRTTNPGLPTSSADFAAAIQLADTAEPLSVETAYDGNTIIHILINNRAGQIKDYPFDITTNAFKSGITLATDGGTVIGDYIGTSGISGMVDKNGALQIAYWSNTNHILDRGYTYTSATNTLTPIGAFFQVDAAGSANHPVVAVSPLDNSLTVAWVSQADNPPQIRARTQASGGTWGAVASASAAPVWTSAFFGINIDQGPSLLIDSNGKRHLTYIENYDGTGNYGRIHYVANSGAGWVDQALATYSNDPALALTSAGTMYIIGHGYPNDPTCPSLDDLCAIKKNGATWDAPQLFATHPVSQSFDSSPSVKWSAVGWNRPDTIEFLFFAAPYTSPMLYYGRIPDVPTAVTLESFQARTEWDRVGWIFVAGIALAISAGTFVWMRKRIT